MNYQYFFDYLSQLEERSDEPFSKIVSQWLQVLPEHIELGLCPRRYGDLPRWRAVYEQLPEMTTTSTQLDSSQVSAQGTSLSASEQLAFKELLMGLHPWRKGPFNLFGVHIDTEWRSDWKWDRLKDHIAPLTDRRVLDVGCGSGYHCWRMRGAGAELVVGIDPTPLFILQFFTLQKYLQEQSVTVLPLGIEQLPAKLHFFDTVFSMGILYHRRSPFDHLMELRDCLVKGGELVLETLVIEGKAGEVLVPQGRYARMGNVWFLPSCETLTLWLQRVGFRDIKLLDVSQTTTEEQRSTEWMTFHSLAQFLDPENPEKSIEGYPAPRRAIFTATAP